LLSLKPLHSRETSTPENLTSQAAAPGSCQDEDWPDPLRIDLSTLAKPTLTEPNFFNPELQPGLNTMLRLATCALIQALALKLSPSTQGADSAAASSSSINVHQKIFELMEFFFSLRAHGYPTHYTFNIGPQDQPKLKVLKNIPEFSVPADQFSQSMVMLARIFEPQIKKIDTAIRSVIQEKPFGMKLIAAASKRLKSFSEKMYKKEELEDICRELQLDPGLFSLMQILYSVFAACTSIAVRTQTGIQMIRTMDWDMPFLEDMTVKLNLMDPNQKCVGRAIVWPGCIGMYTVEKPGAYTISINFREKGSSPLSNLKRLYSGGAQGKADEAGAPCGVWTPDFLLRHILETCESYEEAFRLLATTPLTAPCYFTMTGNASDTDTACILTRNRGGKSKPVADLQFFADQEEMYVKLLVDAPGVVENRTPVVNNVFMIQTNMDNYNPPKPGKPTILHSKERFAATQGVLASHLDTSQPGKMYSTLNTDSFGKEDAAAGSLTLSELLHAREDTQEKGEAFPFGAIINQETIYVTTWPGGQGWVVREPGPEGEAPRDYQKMIVDLLEEGLFS
jgi:hypothetical protein